MKSLLPVLSIIIAVGLPLQANVTPVLGDDYVYGWPRNENFPNFDPATAAINALNATNPRIRGSRHLGLVDTRGRNGGSSMHHQLRCQAKYETYDMISDTYVSNSGMPRRCKF
jgi:hypothetical protein